MTSLILYITKTIDTDKFYLEIDKYRSGNVKIISLSPYSSYLLDQKNIEYKNMHDFIDKKYLREKSLELLNILETNYSNLAVNNLFFKFLYRNYHTLFFVFRSKLLVNKLNEKFDDIVLFSNVPFKKDIAYDEEINNSFIYIDDLNLKEFIFFKTKSNNVKIKKLKITINNNLIYKLFNKLFKTNFNYDWVYFFSLHSKKSKFSLNNNLKKTEYIKLPNEFYIDEKKLNFLIEKQFLELSKKHDFKLNSIYLLSTMHMGQDYERDYCAYKNNIMHFNWQHGSYLYKGLFLKYYETNFHKINFVFNKYTEELYKKSDVKKVHNVGSVLFNKLLKKRKKEYDFVYITQGHDYTGNLQYVDFPNSLHNFDGYDLYQRHKDIIELFGLKNKDKKILIRVHPTVVTNGVYVPFWELSEKYPNIIIDVSIPIHTLIEKSKFIISDYFTSEFINRELHYKRDIILFQGAPTPLPTETIDDMKKMFILVDTVDDLEDKVQNIEEITKDRKRYDDIIEYYSSKKCDTKKVVTEILQKEFNEGR